MKALRVFACCVVLHSLGIFLYNYPNSEHTHIFNVDCVGIHSGFYVAWFGSGEYMVAHSCVWCKIDIKRYFTHWQCVLVGKVCAGKDLKRVGERWVINGWGDSVRFHFTTFVRWVMVSFQLYCVTRECKVMVYMLIWYIVTCNM